MHRSRLSLSIVLAFAVGGCASAPTAPDAGPAGPAPEPQATSPADPTAPGWSFDGAEAATTGTFPALRYTLATRGHYSDGCSQTSIFGTREGTFVLDIAADGRVVAGLQAVSRETVGPGFGGSGAWENNAWLHTWLWLGSIEPDELDDGELAVTLQPAVDGECDANRPAEWEAWQPWGAPEPNCSEAAAPLVLRCVEQRRNVPETSPRSQATQLPTMHAVDVVVCEIDGAPHHDVIGDDGLLVLATASGLTLSNSADEHMFIDDFEGRTDRLYTFVPSAP